MEVGVMKGRQRVREKRMKGREGKREIEKNRGREI